MVLGVVMVALGVYFAGIFPPFTRPAYLVDRREGFVRSSLPLQIVQLGRDALEIFQVVHRSASHHASLARRVELTNRPSAHMLFIVVGTLTFRLGSSGEGRASPKKLTFENSLTCNPTKSPMARQQIYSD